MLIYGAEFTANPGQAGALAAEVTKLRDAVASATDQRWWAWVVVAGRPYGTFMLSSRFDGIAALVAAQQAVAGDPAFQALSGGAYTGVSSGPAVTSTADVVAMTGEATDPPPFVMLTQAQIKGGRLAAAMEWSGRVTEHVKASAGVDTMLISSAAGTLFQLGYIAGFETAAEIDQANEAMSTDAKYLEMLDEAGDMFVTGTVDRVIGMRMP